MKLFVEIRCQIWRAPAAVRLGIGILIEDWQVQSDTSGTLSAAVALQPPLSIYAAHHLAARSTAALPLVFAWLTVVLQTASHSQQPVPRILTIHRYSFPVNVVLVP